MRGKWILGRADSWYHFNTANLACLFDYTYLDRYLGPIPQWTGLVTLFTVGMVFYAWREKIPRRLPLFVAAAGIVLLDVGLCCMNPYGAASQWGHFFWPIIYPPLTGYVVFWLAFQPYVSFPHFARFGDFSYGTYLYAFPIQQSIQAIFGWRSALAIFILATPVTLLFAIGSWYGVERYFIRRKHTRHALEITHVPAFEVLPGAGQSRQL